MAMLNGKAALELQRIRNIGISAHIDSGKTTLSERILYYTGRIHRIEEVRSKTGGGPTLDFMELEREKGITIQAAATYCAWKGHHINLIDTPGHVDFTIEVERALRVLDGAILVLCGVAGVQSQTITVDRQMQRYRVPRLAFINKLDRPGANPDKVLQQMREKLRHRPALITLPIGLEDRFEGVIDLLSLKALRFEGANGEHVVEQEIPPQLLEEAQRRRQELIETVADVDDAIAEKFLADEPISTEELIAALRRATLRRELTPVYVGSAKTNKGVQPLLDGVCLFLPSPLDIPYEAIDRHTGETVQLHADPSLPLVAFAFKLEDGRYGQLTYVRIYQGTLRKGDTIINMSTGKRQRVPRIGRIHADQLYDVEVAGAGDIVALFGVECASGDTFTDGQLNVTLTGIYVPSPVIELAIAPKDRNKQANFAKALNRFMKEDPTFQVARDEETGQTLIRGMGELHLEIYIERMRREYDCEVDVGRPQVAYRETITRRAEFNYLHKKQTGGAGQFARVAGYIEPLPPESGKSYEFVDQIVGGAIAREFIPACDKGFQEAMQKGLLIGKPVVGVRVVLNDGQTHPVDSSELAFKIASMAAFREAYLRAEPIILEPIMKLEVSVPEEFQGTVIGQINQRRGVIVNTTVDNGYAIIEAEVPLAEMFGYSTDLRSATQGKGEFTLEFLRYAPVPRSLQEELVREYQKRRELEKVA
ncbi:Elongation factor G [bacterium HR21]|uniref:Elongation factor G n=1 Tax=uncultured Chlorobiota bacterium TaxID=156405 RepID=H5SGR0_9BACT|nr:elongation factor EF-G [uncultured Chlorobiota bacterium]GBD06724.1 Elongation factor G [bacterium HR21]